MSDINEVSKSQYYIYSDEYTDIEKTAIIDNDCSFLAMSGLGFEEGESIYLEKRLDVFFSKNSVRGEMTDKLQIDINGIVLSERAKEILDLNGCHNIQYFPMLLTDNFVNNNEVELAKMKGKELKYESKIYENYQVANILGLVDCVDHENSDLDYYTLRTQIPEDLPENMKASLLEQEIDNDIDFIRHLVLDESKIPEDIHIFRLKDCPRILVFKESIVKAIREAELTGFVFIPLEEYTDEIPDEEEDESPSSEDFGDQGGKDVKKGQEVKDVEKVKESPSSGGFGDQRVEEKPKRSSIIIKRRTKN